MGWSSGPPTGCHNLGVPALSDLESGEKFSMGKHPEVLDDVCAKQLVLDGEGDHKSNLDGFECTQEELEAVELEQSLLEEMLAQQNLEIELLKAMERVSFFSDPIEQERSWVNRTIPASSKIAPSALVNMLAPNFYAIIYLSIFTYYIYISFPQKISIIDLSFLSRFLACERGPARDSGL